MANEVRVFGETGLNQLRAFANAKLENGMLFLRFSKQGEWTYGAEETEPEEDEEWALNPDSVSVGYICWDDGKPFGEFMASIMDTTPVVKESLPEAPPSSERGWEPQVGVNLKSLKSGIEVTYKASSKGGRDLIADIAGALVAQANDDPGKPIPIVRLAKSGYKHKKYGWTNTPSFEIVRWESVDTLKKGSQSAVQPKRRALI